MYVFYLICPVACLKSQNMANDEGEDASWSFRPQILYVKCKKGLSQEKVQESIVRSLKEVSENCDRDLPPSSDFHVDRLASGDLLMQDADIAQVAIGPRYIGVLLKNGLVYRARCCSKTPRKVKLSSTTTDKVPFLVRSDRSFARQLQQELDGRRSGRHRRIHMDLDEMSSGSRRGFLRRRYRDHDFDHFSAAFPARNEARGNTSEGNNSTQTENAIGISEPTLINGGQATLGSVRATRLASGRLSSNPTPEQSSSPLPRQRSVFDVANERTQRNATQSMSTSNAVSPTPSRQTVNTSIHQTARQTLALAQILQHQSEMLRNFVGSQQQTSTTQPLPSLYSRVQYHSPVIRTAAYYYPTTFGRDLLPSRYISGALENRRIAPVFSRRGRSFPAPAFVRQVSIENPVFIQVGGDSSSKKQTSDANGSRVESKKTKQFDWPVTGEMEWLETEMEKEVKFAKIAAMTSAFLLVTDSGQLFEWPYENTESEETDCLSFFDRLSCPNPPKAVPHPLARQLELEDKRVCLIATCGIRASVLTTSGHLCTFYDELVKDCKPEQPPSLIQELSHPASLFPSLVGESIVCVECDEFYSVVMTSSGNCYWWGLLSGGERRDLEEKLSKIKREVHLSVGDKVKPQKIERGSPGTLVYKLHESLGPCVGQIVEEEDSGRAGALSSTSIKVEIIASGVEISKINVTGRETASPGSSQDASHTGSESSSAISEPAQLPSLVDTWELSDVVFLEDDQACLGVVFGTDGPHVIVEVGQGAPFSKPQYKVFRNSELQKIPADAREVQGTSAVFKKEQSIYGRFLQASPKSIMECCGVSCASPDASSTGASTKRSLQSLGYKAISIACTKEGVALLVSNPEDKVYYLGPACENLGDCSKRFTCSSEVGSTAGNGQVSVTVDSESVLGRDSALRPNRPSARLEAPDHVGRKRKLSASDEDDNHTIAEASSLQTKTLSCEEVFPRLVCSSALCGTILLDSNGCIFPRILNTKLNGFHSLEISPFQCFDMGERKVAFENEDYNILVIPLVFKQQSLLKSIQTGLASEVVKVLRRLECVTSLNAGKGGKLKGKKKVAVQHHIHSGPVAVEKETSSFGNDVTPEVSAVLSERVSGNRNILHLCCSNLCIRRGEQDTTTINDVLNAYETGNTKKDEDPDIEVLQILLEHPLFGSEIMGKLREKDVNGCTPFSLALRCHNFKASLFILDYLKDKESAGFFVDWKAMVYCRSSAGETPLHIASMKSCAGLGLTGLGNSLSVSNLPANYTPRMLLKLFQSRYPSAYRATIPPLEDVEKAHSLTAWQKRETKLKGPSVVKTWKSNESPATSKSSIPFPVAPSSASSFRYGNRLRNGNGQRRESLEGMVTFACLKEMRKALCEMDKHMVSNELGHPDVGLTSVVQHILHVKLAKLNGESNNEDTPETEMDFGGVLNGLGCSPKINNKNKPVEVSEETQKVEEDELISKLVRRLLQNPEIAVMSNREGETALGFLVNYSKWIKPSDNQKKRFQAYSQTKTDNKNSNSNPEKTTKTPESASSTPSKPTAATTAGTSSSALPLFPGVLEESPDPWNEIMVEFDELKNNFSNLVKSLECFEKVGENDSGNESACTSTSNSTDGQNSARIGVAPNSVVGRKNTENMDVTADSDNTKRLGSSSEPIGSGVEQSGSSPTAKTDLIDFATDSVEPTENNIPPVLLQLARSWPCVAKTVLGMTIDDETILRMLGTDPNAVIPFVKPSVSEACDLDFFVQELLSDADEVVLDAVSNTITEELNKHSFSFRDYVDAASDEGNWNPVKLTLHVAQRFLRSVARQLCFLLSHSNMAFVQLPGSTNERDPGRRGKASEVKRRARRVLSTFSWLSVYELVEAAEAVVCPFRDGVAKPQRSTGKDFGNVNNPIPVLQNTFPPQYGAPRGRPGIRVSGGDHGSASDTHPLRTASRVFAESEPSASHYFSGVRLVDVEENASETRSNGSSKRTQSRLSGVLRRQPSPLPSQNGDSGSDDSEDDGADRIPGETDMVIDNNDGASGSAVTGITHEHPFSWALDGRLTSSAESNNSGMRTINFGVPVGNISPPSVHAGNCYLARMFSRLVKEVIDVLKIVDREDKESRKDSVVLKVDERSSILEYCEGTLERSWLWLINVMDTVEGQLHRGKHFDTKRYLVSLQQNGDPEIGNVSMSRSSVNMPGATPEEYLMFLLRSHTNEHKDTLPVMDMLCYEHAVYVLDAFLYVLKGWPRSDKNENPDSSSTKDDGIKANMNKSTQQISTESNAMSLDEEALRRFFLSSNQDATFEDFAVGLKRNLQSTRTYVPSVSWELFNRQNSLVNLEERLRSRDAALPVSYRGLSSREVKLPIMNQWSADEVCERWMICIDVFSRLFLAEGPGGERDSFLAARAGTAGRIARFRRALAQLRETVNTDQQQGIFGAYGFSGRIGTVLSLNVRRSHLLEDMLKFLGEMSSLHYTNFRVKFEGEEGSGPGVNRGFFAAVANTLKADEKPAGTTSLLYEPGKLPEQSGYFSPRPCGRNTLLKQEPELLKRRRTMFKSIGRFLGLCLWFNNTIPLNLTRSIIKYILGSEIVWQDLAFFNADLFDGLSRMIVDSLDPAFSEEAFQSTYCCHFEVSIAGEIVELITNGSQVPVTKSQTFQYARLYAQKVMVDCVEEESSAMKEGLHEVIPLELLEPLTTEDFQLLISGGNLDIDINRLKAITSFVNSNGCSTDILGRFKKWFWSIVNKMTPMQRQQLLYFATGSAMLPAMPERKDNDQDDLSITIDIIRGNPKALPMASTCGQRMSVPLYPSRRILKRKLLQAIQCQTYGMG